MVGDVELLEKRAPYRGTSSARSATVPGSRAVTTALWPSGKHRLGESPPESGGTASDQPGGQEPLLFF